MESGAALGAELNDVIPETSYSEGRIKGKAMTFTQAHLKIADQQKEVVVDNNLQSAIIVMEVAKGETELTAYFDMEDGVKSNAFYVYVEKVDKP